MSEKGRVRVVFTLDESAEAVEDARLFVEQEDGDRDEVRLHGWTVETETIDTADLRLDIPDAAIEELHLLARVSERGGSDLVQRDEPLVLDVLMSRVVAFGG